MKGFILGFLICILIFVTVLENIHVQIEKVYDFRWCSMLAESVKELYGEPVRDMFYVIYKVFQVPVKVYRWVNFFKDTPSTKIQPVKITRRGPDFIVTEDGYGIHGLRRKQ